jgi:hypothetical protein
VATVNVLESVDAWLGSRRRSFDLAGIEVRFQRSPPDRLKSSLAVSLRRGNREADLVVWESGEGELVLGDPTGSAPVMQHYDDLQIPGRLNAVFAAMLEAVEVTGRVAE